MARMAVRVQVQKVTRIPTGSLATRKTAMMWNDQCQTTVNIPANAFAFVVGNMA